MFPQLGPPIGFFIATGLFLLLLVAFGEKAFVDWAWRVPFLISAALVAIGLYVRISLEETPAFKAALAQNTRVAVPLGAVLKTTGCRSSRVRCRSSSATPCSISRRSTRWVTASGRSAFPA